MFSIYTAYRQGRTGRGFFLLPIVFTAVFIADSNYNFSVVLKDISHWRELIQESCYSIFMIGLLSYVVVSYRSALKWPALISALILAIGHAWLSQIYILDVYFGRPIKPELPFSLLSVLYSYASSALFGILFPVISRTNSLPRFVIFSSILLLLCSDFTIRYQSAAISQTTFSWADPCWSIAMAGIAWSAFFFKNAFESQVGDIASNKSVRVRLAQAFLLAAVVEVAGIYLLKMDTIWGAFDLTVVLLWLYVVWIIANCVSLYFSSKVNRIQLEFARGPTAGEGNLLGLEEMDEIIVAHRESLSRELDLKMRLMTAESIEARVKLSEQVAHDIGSPLAALEMLVSELRELPEESRLILRSAVTRIRDISNDLLVKSRTIMGRKRNDNDTDALVEPHLLSALFAELVTEKRLQCRGEAGKEIELSVHGPAYGAFSMVNAKALRRVLSNLMNNSLEAIQTRGRVTLDLNIRQGLVQIVISDNGKGIPSEVLPRLMKRGETFDKPGGSGLGLYHAKETLTSWNGTLALESTLGRGTKVMITLPLAKPPAWFLSELQVPRGAVLIVIDDDVAIHQIWQRRFEKFFRAGELPEILHFSQPQDLKAWWAEHAGDARPRLYLCDYEFLSTGTNGLDLIEELGIISDAVLVTSRYEETVVKSRCERLGVKLLPKALAGFVPLA